MSQRRWAPTLPTLGGRLASRVKIPCDITGYASKLEAYYLSRQSCQDIFVRRVSAEWLRDHRHAALMVGGVPPYLRELPGGVLYSYMLSMLGSLTMSENFQRKLSAACLRGDIGLLKRWWYTADGVVYPVLLSCEDPDLEYQAIDRLTKFCLENCANNYAQFTSRMKSLKRLLRKDYATDSTEAKGLTDLATYRDMYLRYFPKDQAHPELVVQYILCWSQTRASGLADSVMMRRSLDKCEATLTLQRRPMYRSTPATRSYGYRGLPKGEPELPKDILRDISCRVRDKMRGETAHISAGPNACLESPRQTGGQTGYIKALCRRPAALKRRYDFRTLEHTPVCERIGGPTGLVSWAIDMALNHPTHTRMVRLHSVPEPSKARTITVCSLPYLIIVGVIAKLLQPAIASSITRGGLHASRNLWNFLFNDLDPDLGLWGALRDQGGSKVPLMALSSDLSEATDYGDIGVARQLLDGIISKCSEVPGFPTGLAVLAKTLFIGKRYCLRYHEGRGYRFFVKRNGWLMGDRLTKVILTLAHEMVVISSGLFAARICGDDVIAFSRFRESLERYLYEVTRLGFQLSEEDTYISTKLAFYCEEAMVPALLKYMHLPAPACRRKKTSCYVDYPRIRLLISTSLETRAYSYTDTGRFALLGKECRWVHQNRLEPSFDLFKRASMLQHLNVPQPSDTLCPFLPIEIGGDGGFPHSPEFLRSVVERKSRDPNEARFRLASLLTSKWGYRLVRSPCLNMVVHKYHLMLPKVRELRELIPPDAIIDGNELLLGSVKVPGVETPERTFLRLWHAYHWSRIYETGREPPKLTFPTDKALLCPEAIELDLTLGDYSRFVETWCQDGFTFRDTPDYLVISDKVKVLDYNSMGWWFGKPPLRHDPRPSLNDIGGAKLLSEENVMSFLMHLQTGADLDPKVADHLYKYVEADSYILYELSKRPKDRWPRFVLLVSQDKRLGIEIVRLLQSQDENAQVALVPPECYLFGMMDRFEEWTISLTGEMPETIVDFGAVAYSAATSSGRGVWYDHPVIVSDHAYPHRGYTGVYVLAIDQAGSGLAGLREEWSLTTRPASEIRPGAFVPRILGYAAEAHAASGSEAVASSSSQAGGR